MNRLFKDMGIDVRLFNKASGHSLREECKHVAQQMVLEAFKENWPKMLPVEDVLERSARLYLEGSTKGFFFSNWTDLYLVKKIKGGKDDGKWGIAMYWEFCKYAKPDLYVLTKQEAGWLLGDRA